MVGGCLFWAIKAPEALDPQNQKAHDVIPLDTSASKLIVARIYEILLNRIMSHHDIVVIFSSLPQISGNGLELDLLAIYKDG